MSKSLQVPASTPTHAWLSPARPTHCDLEVRETVLGHARLTHLVQGANCCDVCSVELQSHRVTWWCPRREPIMAHQLRDRAHWRCSYCFPGSCQGKDACLHTGTSVERRHLESDALLFALTAGRSPRSPPRPIESTSTADPLREYEHDKTRGAATTQTDMGFHEPPPTSTMLAWLTQPLAPHRCLQV